MPPKRLVLEVADGDVPPTELPRSGVLTIGCSSERAGFVLSGAEVADVHCAIGRIKGGGWALKDLGTSTGTRVNGSPVKSVRLSAGDEIQIGARRVRVVDPEAPAGAPAPSTRATKPEKSRADAKMPLPRLTGYRVEKQLGRGSMGRVYLAVQESLHRPVALKVLPPRLAHDEDFVRRFQAEARAAAALNHNNVVTVYDVGEDGGLHFLSMEYMARGSLESRLAAAERLPWREVLAILIDAARGLVFAEGRGIVHRDIKPANLMQTEDGVTKIADLGLATQLEAEATETMGSKVFGTPHFIAPEQARGEAVDGRTDLYSLGASAFQMLTGRTPFQGDSTREILRAHFFDQPPSVRDEVPEVPDELARLVGDMLQKEPEKRPASASVVVEALEVLHARERADSASSAGGRKLAVAVVAVLLLGGAAGAFLWQQNRAPAENDTSPGFTAADPLDGGAPVGANTQPTTEPTTPDDAGRPEVVQDDDQALKLLELEAQLRVSQLSVDLSLADRRDALLAIAAEFAGTTESTRIADEVLAIEERIAAEAAAVDDRATAFTGVLGAMRSAYAGPEGSEPRPREGLLAALTVPGQDALAAYPEFQAARRELVGQALSDLRTHAQVLLRTAREAVQSGEFEVVEARLAEAVDALAPFGADAWGAHPELPAEHATALEELAAVRREARTRLALVDYERERFAALRAGEEAVMLAAELAGPDGLAGQLARLELDAAAGRLRSLAASLSDERTRTWAQLQADQLELARDALALLGPTLVAGEWRRMSVLDPESRRRVSAVEAVSIDAAGVRVNDGGDLRVLPWSAFGADPKSIDQLFLERLERDYTPQELQGIAALVRFAAVLQAVQSASEVLASGSFVQFGEEEREELLAGFELARPWAEQADSIELLEREHAAASELAEALRLAGRDAWSSTTAAIEKLLSGAADTLLVRLLSDGHGLSPELPAEPPPPVFEEAPPRTDTEEDSGPAAAASSDSGRSTDAEVDDDSRESD